jgi:mediator of RNA polymerase II transcription subunit 13
MSIDPHPPVSVFPSPPPTATIAQTLIQESKGTPVSTPQPGISPDPHSLTPASTPSASVDPTATDLISDPDAHLVDIGDETYGLVLGHRVNVLAANNASQSGSGPREYRPSLSSGYLFKTNTVGGTPLDCAEGREVKGVVLVGVHLVWVGTSPRPNQQNQQQSQQQAQATAGSSPFSPIDASAPPTPGSAAAPQNVAPTGSQNMGTSIPRTTADSILREYLGLFRNLGTLARARGIGGTLRGALPWHAVVALRGVQGLEETFGNLNEGSD